MTKTIELLDKALHIKRASDWAKAFNIDRSTLSQAKKVGRLSPVLAGNLAIELGENAEHWMAIAAMEAEKDSPLLERLKRSSQQWLYT